MQHVRHVVSYLMIVMSLYINELIGVYILKYLTTLHFNLSEALRHIYIKNRKILFRLFNELESAFVNDGNRVCVYYM